MRRHLPMYMTIISHYLTQDGKLLKEEAKAQVDYFKRMTKLAESSPPAMEMYTQNWSEGNGASNSRRSRPDGEGGLI